MGGVWRAGGFGMTRSESAWGPPAAGAPAPPWRTWTAPLLEAMTSSMDMRKPVARTVMETSPLRESSPEVPKMMFASGWTVSCILQAAWLTSWMERSSPPTMLKTTAVACLMGESRRGQEVAAMAASTARSLPRPMPMPMRAVPALAMTARTSAKSTLIIPGLTMMSEMPTTPWRRMSSATRKALATGVPSGTISRRRSLETTMSVSTASWRFRIDSTAWVMRLRPSKEKGLVTTPTVRAPISRATCATTGAAPLPVPPPMPAVTKTMSEPAMAAAISARDSSAAASPFSGSPPAPSPRVVSRPMFIVFAASDRLSAWASVLSAQNSTPVIAVSTIRFTAFPPPPPTPITLMQHGAHVSGYPSAVIGVSSAAYSSSPSRDCRLAPRLGTPTSSKLDDAAPTTRVRPPLPEQRTTNPLADRVATASATTVVVVRTLRVMLLPLETPPPNLATAPPDSLCRQRRRSFAD
mmetsp:Transcript_17291/g.54014  ORF Transcript_17291/g.54014 Transcript_17291/m.54014 type:complete len:467 (+) Transcript_17291:333-1733(+)